MSTRRPRRSSLSQAMGRIQIAMLVGSLAAGPAWSLPEGGRVVGGEAQINRTSSERLDVVQSSNRAMIDWNSFSIAAGEHANFALPSAKALVANRVVGADPSSIFGTLTSNGRVVLINQNGIHFGPSARVDVASLVATTAGVRNDDFMAGRLEFLDAGVPGASIVNEGHISVADEGLVAFVAPWVRNDGVIHAKLGKVVLGGAERFTLDLYGDGLVEIELPQGADADSGSRVGVEMAGEIQVDGGEFIAMTAGNARAAVDSVINLDGIVQARTIEARKGRIAILGDDASVVRVAGRLDASGRDAGEQGGRIDVRGREVELASGARLSAAGDAGGGIVHVGGGFQGAGPLPTSEKTTFDASAQIDVDALGAGDGGEVVVWADGTTTFEGSITGRGAEGGRGGLVEVSGKEHLEFAGDVGLGAGGRLLLDPTELTVAVTAGLDTVAAVDLRRMLIDGMDVELLTDGNINIDATIDGRVDVGGTPGGAITARSTGGDVRVNADLISADGAISIEAGGRVDMASTGGRIAEDGSVSLFVSDGGAGLGSADIKVLAGDGATLQSLSTKGGVDVETDADLVLAGRIDAGALGDPLTAGISASSTNGSVSIEADLFSDSAGIEIMGRGGVTATPSGRLIVSDGATGLGDATISVASTDGSVQTGVMATAGGVEVEAGLGLTVQERIDAGLGGVSLVAEGGNLAIDQDVVTQGGDIVVQASAGDVVVSPTGGGLTGGGPVALVVADGTGNGLGDGGLVIESEAGSAALGILATGGSVAVTTRDDLAVDGRVDAGAAGVTLRSTLGDIDLAADVVTDSGSVNVRADAGNVSMASTGGVLTDDGSAAIVVASSAGALGGGSVTVTAGQSAELQTLATAGTVSITAVDDVNVGGRVDAGAGGVAIASSAGDVHVNADVITVDGPIALSAAGDVSMAAMGGEVAESGAVSLAVADAPPGTPGVGVGRGAVSVQAGGTADLQAIGTRGDVTIVAGTEVVLGEDLGTRDDPTGGVAITAGRVSLPGAIVTENAAVDIDATAGDLVLGDEIFVSAAAGTTDVGIGDVDLAFATGDLDLEGIATRGRVAVAFTGPDVDGQGNPQGRVALVGPLGGENARVGGVDIDAPLVDQRSAIVATGDVRLGRAGGLTFLRNDIFTNGGEFLARSDVIIDPRTGRRSVMGQSREISELLDVNGDPVLVDVIVGVDVDGNAIVETRNAREPFDLATPDTVVGDLMDAGQPFFDINGQPVKQLRLSYQDSALVQNSDLADLFPSLRQEASGGLIDSIWQLTIDTTSPGGASGDIRFAGRVEMPVDLRIDSLSGFDGDDTPRDAVQNDFFISAMGEDAPDVPSELFGEKFGLFEFIELTLDAGESTIEFGGSVGSEAPFVDQDIGFGPTSSELQLNIESAGALVLQPDEFVAFNLLRIPTDLVALDSSIVLPGGSHYVFQVDAGQQDFGDPLPPIGLTFDLDGDGTPGPLTAFLAPRDGVDPAEGLVGAILRRNSIDPGTSFFTSTPGGVGNKADPGTFNFRGGGDGLFPSGFGSTTGGGDPTAGSAPSVGGTQAPGAGGADPAPPPPASGTSGGDGTVLGSVAETNGSTGDEEDVSTDPDEGDREFASSWTCPTDAPSAYQSTPADSAFGNDSRSNPYSVDPFCGDYALVGVVRSSDERYGGLSYAAGDFWTDAAQARSADPIPAFAPTSPSAVASGPPGDGS